MGLGVGVTGQMHRGPEGKAMRSYLLSDSIQPELWISVLCNGSPLREKILQNREGILLFLSPLKLDWQYLSLSDMNREAGYCVGSQISIRLQRNN